MQGVIHQNHQITLKKPATDHLLHRKLDQHLPILQYPTQSNQSIIGDQSTLQTQQLCNP
jgi:hypothetical protein